MLCTVLQEKMSTIAKAYYPPRTTSQGVYNYIKNNIEIWIKKAIQITKNNFIDDYK